MILIVFRSHLRPGGDAEIAAEGERMYELASRMPGFISYHEFVAADGENLTLIEFDTHENLAAWREHPEHKVVQERGREHFFSEYRIQVCEIIRHYGFTRDTTQLAET